MICGLAAPMLDSSSSNFLHSGHHSNENITTGYLLMISWIQLSSPVPKNLRKSLRVENQNHKVRAKPSHPETERKNLKTRASPKQKSWTGSYSSACPSSTFTAARFFTVISRRKTFSWQRTTRSNWATLASRKSSSAPKTTRWLCRERLTTCRRRFAKTSHTLISLTFGPSAASCTRF